MGSSFTSISRRQWGGRTQVMIGPPSLLPQLSQDPAPQAFQVCLSVCFGCHNSKTDKKNHSIFFYFVIWDNNKNKSSFIITLKFNKTYFCLYVHTPESQSNHSSQSDSGISEMALSGHTRSQSVVSSIFSDAWRRGTQGEVWTHTDSPHPVLPCHSLFLWTAFALIPSASLPSKVKQCVPVLLCTGTREGGSGG